VLTNIWVSALIYHVIYHRFKYFFYIFHLES